MPDRVEGSAIFADVSGFTPLTEALATELGPQRGAEELTAALNVVFDAVLGELHRFGGSVIYFSGDAVTCWLDGDDGTLGVACGLAMQDAMGAVSTIVTPGGATVRLAMKVAVSAGRARRFVVGDPEIQLLDVLAGVLMDRLAATEHNTEPGEVVVDSPTLARIADRVDLAIVRDDGRGRFGVVAALAGPPPVLPPPASYPKLPRSIARQWLLPPVYQRMRSGRGEFLSELRPGVPMFVRFGGIDYEEDPHAHMHLDHFVQRAQRAIAGYGGNVLQLTIGDKGSYLYAVFGSPLAHEDDATRACAAAIEVLALSSDTAATGIQVGIAQGPVRSGTYGHWHRRTFCCLGDPVNLAARLMSAAPAGQIYVTASVARDAGTNFAFEELADIKVKGKAVPVKVRRLVSRSRGALQRQRGPLGHFVGRSAELETMLRLGRLAKAGPGRLVAVVAEAGMGKSRLAQEVVRSLSDEGVRAYTGEAASVGSGSYLIWQGVWAGLFGLSGGSDVVPELERALRAVDPALVPRLPLLGAVIGAPLDDNRLTGTFDAKSRKSSLEALLVRYLRLRAEREPLALVLEDCHWIDPLSADLLQVVARAVATLPVLVIMTYREGPFSAPKLPYTTVVELQQLDMDGRRELVRSRLRELYPEEFVASEALLHRLTERAEGNPFYLEELVNYLHAQGADLTDEKVVGSLALPDSLATLVLSRIDTLAERPRRTLKVASAVGREFDVGVLTGAYPDLGTERQVSGYLRRLCAHDLVTPEGQAPQGYAFKHAIIRQVAYESLPFATRAVLHGRIGLFLEATDPQALDLLAHHFWHGADEDKKLEYLLRAGEAAEARYANEAAVGYYRRAAPLLPDRDRGPVLSKLGAVLELRGEWAEAEAVYTEALDLAESLADSAAAAWAYAMRSVPLRKQGRYQESEQDLDEAWAVFERLGDRSGLAKVAHLRGSIANLRGDPQKSREYFRQSLAMYRVLGDRRREAQLLGNLGVPAMHLGEYEVAQELAEQALVIRKELSELWGIGASLNNLAMVSYLRKRYAEAMSHLEEGLRAALEAGDMYGVAVSQHNLGNTTRQLGDLEAAGGHYLEAVRSYALSGDRWSLCMLFDDIAILAALRSQHEAVRLIGASDALRELIGSPRLDYQQAELEEGVAGVRRQLGPGAAAELAAGRALDLEAATRLASALCHGR
jgi:class 3 adenylate cyclase/tetratricopeptide (TPR) repeat protein